MLRQPGFSLSSQEPSISYSELTFGIPSSTSSRTSTTSGARNSPNVVIVGDTVAALYYAVRVLARDNTTNVAMVVEGPNNLYDSGISNSGFGDKAIYNGYLRPWNSSYITEDSDNRNTTLNLPYGLGADAIATYPSEVEYPPLLGSNNQTGAAALVQRITEEKKLTDGELTISTALASSFGIPITRSIITSGPSVSARHYIFSQCINDDSERDVGYSAYNALVTTYADRCTFYFGCKNIRFSNPQSTRVYDVNFHYFFGGDDVEVTLTGAVYLKSTVYDNVRVATAGNLPSLTPFVNNIRSVPGGKYSTPDSALSTYIPTTYRGVFAVPTNGTVEAGQRLNMTLPSIREGTRINSKAWVVQSFTTDMDLRPNSRVYAPEGKTLVIIEAVSVFNRRILYWNRCSCQFETVLNIDDQEQMFLQEFIQICQRFAIAYGLSGLPPLIEPMVAASGVVRDYTHIEGVTNYLTNPFLLMNECLALFEPNISSSFSVSS